MIGTEIAIVQVKSIKGVLEMISDSLAQRGEGPSVLELSWGASTRFFFASDSFLISTCPIDNAHLVPYSGTPKLLEVELG